MRKCFIIIFIILTILIIGFVLYYDGLTDNFIRDSSKLIANASSRSNYKWPIVDLFNCSRREYMNKGVNSPEVINNRSFPRTGLVSAPGSGNTWTRFLIEQATGLWTGSVFNDGGLYRGGLRGEKENCGENSTVVIKAHSIKQDMKSHCPFDRIILVVRDFHKTLLAEFNRKMTNSHTKSVKEELLKSEKWKNYAESTMPLRLSHINLAWIRYFIGKKRRLKSKINPFTAPPQLWDRLLLVSYERLKRDPARELKRIVEFLGLPVFRENCLKENSKGEFRRKSVRTSQELSCIYSDPKARKKMKQSILYFQDQSRILGTGDITAEFEGIDENNLENKC